MTPAMDHCGCFILQITKEKAMKSAELFLASLRQNNERSLAKPSFVNFSDDIPQELRTATSCGLRVFPVIGLSKYAASKEGRETATSDPARIGDWIRQYQGYSLNWHAITGGMDEDDIVSLEIDYDSARIALLQLCQDNWDWLETLRSQSGDSTGYVFFRWPQAMVMRHFARQLARGLILHGHGDSVPIPPSRNRSGNAHTYLTPQSVIKETPSWLMEADFQKLGKPSNIHSKSFHQQKHSSAA